MNISRRWLEEFLRRPLDPRDLVERLAMLGAPVDAVEPVAAELRAVVVGLVEEVRAHPNADRLRLCLVNDGGPDRRHVVCGASNVAAGAKYPFARVGTTLPGGLVLEKRKIRGEPSEGMLCSARELGLGSDHEGILLLETAAAPGTPLTEALPVDDDRLVVDVTPNRPDLLCHKGVARELAAAEGAPFRLPAIPGAADAGLGSPRREGAEALVGGVRVAIEDAETCPRFTALVIRGVRVGPSPDWLRRRLEAVGQRSINNVVDATNWVMLELNRPMHAFDLARLRGPALVVRRARAGEALVTLDGQRRALDPGMAVVADAESAQAVGGVMGGEASEVSEATTDLFLECAWWLPARIRATRKSLGLSTEASYRFERGVDPMNGAEAVRRCAEIILATGGGEVRGEIVDLWPQPTFPPRVFLRPARVAQVLGVDVPWARIEDYLTRLGCTVLSKPDDGRMAVEVPGWRPDLRAEIDLVEEVARMLGYGELPDGLRPFRVGELPDDPREIADDRIRDGLVGQGLREAKLLPLVPAAPALVGVINPLSADHGSLRAELLPGLAAAVERNWAAHVRDVRLFEIGTAFGPADGGGDRPAEERRVAGVITGAREPAHWTASGRVEDADLWDLRGLFEAAVGLANPGARVQVAPEASDRWVAVRPDGSGAGWAGAIPADRPPWAAPLFGFEVAIDPAPREPVLYQPLPDTPAVERDLALLLPDGVLAAQVVASARRAGGRLLEAIDVVDEFRGAGVPSGARSVAFRLRFRAPGRTLRDAEVGSAVERFLAALKEDLPGVSLRAT
jgi:phenylalanyl-tRNA synthetase beta chain